MKLSEMLDASDYRSGDENDPRSPYYEDPKIEAGQYTEHVKVEVPTWPVTVGGEEHDVAIVAQFELVFEEIADRRTGDHSLVDPTMTRIDIASITANGTKFSGKDFVAKFGRESVLGKGDEYIGDLADFMWMEAEQQDKIPSYEYDRNQHPMVSGAKVTFM